MSDRCKQSIACDIVIAEVGLEKIGSTPEMLLESSDKAKSLKIQDSRALCIKCFNDNSGVCFWCDLEFNVENDIKRKFNHS